MIATIVAAVAIALVVLEVGVTWGRVLPGVAVGGVQVGWMTPIGARVALETAYAASANRTVTLNWGTERFEVSAAEVGAQIDASASVASALAVGRTGGVLRIIGDRIGSSFGGVQVAPSVQLDTTATTSVLDKIDAAAAEPAVDASVSMHGFQFTVATSKPGRALDRPATQRAILEALISHTAAIDAVVVPVRPRVSDAVAQEAKRQAVALAAGPVTVSFQGNSVLVPRATVAKWITFAASGGSALAASFDATRMAPAVASLTVGRVRAAKDAVFVASKGSVRLTPSQTGTGPDLHSLAADLVRVCSGPGPRTATLRIGVSQPRLTTAAAQQMGIADRLSTFTTSYSTANRSRTNNVHLLAKALNGKMVAPGAVFSFNGAAGRRTAAKGYQEAPAIVDGKLVPQLGGGVCQVGTTIFNAVFFSGLPVVERRNHSFYISHYPTGRDATVSWGGPDFKFRNDTDHWILIRTAFTASTLTIALYGTDQGYDVHYTTGSFTDVTPYKTSEVRDPKLAKGARVVEDVGVNGRTVVVTRTVYKGGVVVRTDTFVSHYSPKTEIVRVGTKASTTPSGTPTP